MEQIHPSKPENIHTKVTVRHILVNGSAALDMAKASKLSLMAHITRVSGFSEEPMARENFIIRPLVIFSRVTSTMILFMDKAG